MASKVELHKSIWITWEKQIRNKSMAYELGSKLYEFVYKGNRLKRYLKCAYKTIMMLIEEKPNIVFAQNPSILLNYLLIVARYVFRYTLVSDAHYAGIKAYNNNDVLQNALNLCNRLVDIVIVTNHAHARWVVKHGGTAVIFEDPLPDIEKYKEDEDSTNRIVLFICSFDVDEPYLKAFKAAERLLIEGYTLWVTGNYKKAGLDPIMFPHVRFLGYLPEKEFYANMFRSSVVLDLTENENCLVCGAYEAMAAEKPLVTSDTECLKKYFFRGALFVQNSEKDIASTVKKAYEEREELKKEIRIWKNEISLIKYKRIRSLERELKEIGNE